MKTKSYSHARVRSTSFNEESNTVDVVWSTGSDVVRDDWDGPYVERLLMGAENVRLDRLNNGAPLLDTHSSEALANVIGAVVSGTARIESGKGLATIKLSSAAGDADTVQKIREGVIRNISVGYWVYHSVRQAGESSGPDVHVIDDWEPLEISAVPIPADPGSQFRSETGRKAKRRSRVESAAAYASRLLHQTTQSTDHARGAAEASKLQAGSGTLHTERAKPATLDKLEIERGARAARRLLRRA